MLLLATGYDGFWRTIDAATRSSPCRIVQTLCLVNQFQFIPVGNVANIIGASRGQQTVSRISFRTNNGQVHKV